VLDILHPENSGYLLEIQICQTMSTSSHMLLHIAIDDQMHFKHVFLASCDVGILLFSKYYQETLDKLKSLLGAEGALVKYVRATL
jgi:hypothetical protein